MRVAIITKIFPSEADPLAAPYNLNQFSALRELCEVRVLALVPWFPGAAPLLRLLHASSAAPVTIPRRSVLRGLQIEHPRVLYLPRWGRSISGHTYAASLLPWLPSLRGHVDVLLGSFAYPDGWAATRLGQLLGVPVVIKVHGSDINVQREDSRLRRRLREALGAAAAVVGPSEALIERVIELGVPPSRAHVLYNGVDKSTFFPRMREECRQGLRLESLGIAPQTPLVVCVGRVERSKGVFDLLDALPAALARHPRLHVVFLGDGAALGEARQYAQRGGLPVHWEGSCSPERVALWLGAANLLALPSWAEGTPNAVIEALASGRRVVATRVGGVAALVTQPLLGRLVAPRSPGELAAALSDTLGEPYEPARVAEACPIGDWAQSAKCLHDVLSSVVMAEAQEARCA